MIMKNTIVTGSLIVFSDGFVWKRLSNEKAYKIWVSAENEDFELYKVRVDDESESLIESLEDLQDKMHSKGYVLELNYQNKDGEQKLNGARVIPVSEYKSISEMSKREQMAKKGFKLSDIDRKMNINTIKNEISKNIIKTQSYGRSI